MHEWALVEGVMRIAEEEGARHPGHYVVGIELEIGRLRQVVPEDFQFLFDIARRGTVLERAELVLDIRPVRVHCRDCCADGLVEEPAWMACPRCGGFDVEMVEGDQMLVRSINLEPNG